MSLQRKFAVLLMLSVSTVVVSLGTAYWFGETLQRELVWPFEESTTVLRGLSRLQRDVAAQSRLLSQSETDRVSGGGDDRSRRAEQYRLLAKTARADMEHLQGIPRLRKIAGASATGNLPTRLERAVILAERWFATGEATIGLEAAEAHHEIVALIERIESRLLDDSVHAVRYGDSLRVIHHVVLAAGVITAGLVGLLGVMLMRRWVAEPIAALRRGTIELSRGRLDYRIRITSNDELGMLSTEINHMAYTIATMQEEAVERERLAAVGEMIRRLAHNIRNPLSGIRNLAELTQRRVTDDEAAQSNQQQIIEAVDRFNDWLTKLLGATSPLAVQLSALDIRTCLSGVVESQQPLAQMRSVTLVLQCSDAPDEVMADPRHLEEALVSLVTNAIQASPQGGTVRIESVGTAEHWSVAVEDEGEGIPEELRHKVFRPYFTTKRDGNGIGLAVVKEVARQHGGEIRVETAPGGGARLVLEISASLKGAEASG